MVGGVLRLDDHRSSGGQGWASSIPAHQKETIPQKAPAVRRIGQCAPSQRWTRSSSTRSSGRESSRRYHARIQHCIARIQGVASSPSESEADASDQQTTVVAEMECRQAVCGQCECPRRAHREGSSCGASHRSRTAPRRSGITWKTEDSKEARAAPSGLRPIDGRLRVDRALHQMRSRPSVWMAVGVDCPTFSLVQGKDRRGAGQDGPWA